MQFFENFVKKYTADIPNKNCYEINLNKYMYLKLE